MTGLNDLPDELIEQICSRGPLNLLADLSRTNQRLRRIAKARFEALVGSMYPWIEPSWSRRAFQIERQLMTLWERLGKQSETRIESAEVPGGRIHVNEPVRKEAILLRYPLLQVNGAFWFNFHKN